MFEIDAAMFDYLEQTQPLYTGTLGEIQRESTALRHPIIRHETARFLSVLLTLKKPKRVLEIGCAVGFSASLFSMYLPEGGSITTIDRYDFMIERAKKNFAKMGVEDKVTLIEGDAAEVLRTLPDNSYDFVFLDAGKGQYLQFLPHCIRVLDKDGLFVADDVLQGGTVAIPRENVQRRQRTTHKRMRCFLWTISNTPGLESSIATVGDGLAICVKTASHVNLKEKDINEFE